MCGVCVCVCVCLSIMFSPYCSSYHHLPSYLMPSCHHEQLKPERIAARKLIASHNPEDTVADRHHWMLLTVPEKPVAGEELIVYFNRNASDSLRSVCFQQHPSG